MKVRTVYNLERNSFDIIDLDMENLPTPQQKDKMDTAILVPAKNLEDCMIQFLCKNEFITHDDIETLATQLSTHFIPEGMTMAEIIANVKDKLIED